MGLVPREMAMADRTSQPTESGGELQLIAGVLALVCVALLTTAALA
jgi:hypothetical protein